MEVNKFYNIEYSFADKIRTGATAVLAVSSLALGILGALSGLHALPIHGNMALFLQHHTVEFLSGSIGSAGLSLGLACFRDYQQRELFSVHKTKDQEVNEFDHQMRLHFAARFGIGIVLGLATALVGIEVFHQSIEMFSLLGSSTLLLAPVGVRAATGGILAIRKLYRDLCAVQNGDRGVRKPSGTSFLQGRPYTKKRSSAEEGVAAGVGGAERIRK